MRTPTTGRKSPRPRRAWAACRWASACYWGPRSVLLFPRSLEAPRTGIVAIVGGVLALIGQLLLVPEARRGSIGTKTEVKNFVAPLRLFSEGAPLRYLAFASLCQALCRGESAVYSPFMVDIWGTKSGLALTMTVVGATFAASQALLVGPLVKKFGAAGALRLGYACSTLQRVIWSYYTHPGVMLLGLALGSPGFGADSIIQQLALEYHPSSTPPRGELAASARRCWARWACWRPQVLLGGLFAWGRRRLAGRAFCGRGGGVSVCFFLRFPWRAGEGEVKHSNLCVDPWPFRIIPRSSSRSKHTLCPERRKPYNLPNRCMCNHQNLLVAVIVAAIALWVEINPRAAVALRRRSALRILSVHLKRGSFHPQVLHVTVS